MIGLRVTCIRRGATTFSKLGGSNSLVYGITTLLQKKINRSTQFGAVGYTITLYLSKSYVKSWGIPSKFWGGPDPLTPSGCAHVHTHNPHHRM